MGVKAIRTPSYLCLVKLFFGCLHQFFFFRLFDLSVACTMPCNCYVSHWNGTKFICKLSFST